MKADLHTHTSFSADGKSSMQDMVATAKGMGLRYYGISDHFDYDYLTEGITVCGNPIDYIDAPSFFAAGRSMQRQENDENFTLLIGGEFGFSPREECKQLYFDVIEKYRPDFVVNSVHSVDGNDCYFQEYFTGKSKDYAYRAYLERVRESLDAPYGYDIVAHLGYVSRNAPYPNPKLRYEDYPDLYDDILKTVIGKDKILEVNSSPRTAGSEYLPDDDILTRYFQLGGRKVSFGSDAHLVGRVAEKLDMVYAALRKIGFEGITLPLCGKHTTVKF